MFAFIMQVNKRYFVKSEEDSNTRMWADDEVMGLI